MEFRILGPLEVRAGSRRLDVGGIRQQTVLAMLLLSAGQVVTAYRLLEAVYGEDLPPTSRSQLQTSISALRRLLAADGGTGIIATYGQGYVLQAGDGELDYRHFAELIAAARAAHDSGQLDQAVVSYRDALRLWRGPALAGLDSLLIRAAASHLDEQRITALEERIAVELDLGRHHELVGELTELVIEFPLRERLRGQLMIALHRCARTAEALRTYRQARQTMIEELGIEPGEGLQQLERDILRNEPSLRLPAEPLRIRPHPQQMPRQLPADIADFTGRAEHVSQIHQHLIGAAPEASPALRVVVIEGTGGVGKTSLAVHASHGAAGQFGDGQLFADLHGWSPRPVDPTHVLGRFLRALGVPGPQIPEGQDERAEIYRSLIASRRILVVLDDAVNESQLSPLLPGAGPAAVIVTSRSRLAGLAGATHVELDVLEPGTSVGLLGRIVGTGRVQAQSRAALAVAEECGCLPLALRIAGARLAARPHWSIQQLADRLADETRRLDELKHGEMGVRASISLSYEGATERAQLLLRRLALLEAPAFSAWTAAALLDLPVNQAEDALDDLVRARLIEATGGGSGVHSHYRFHELIRVFARERLAEEPATDRTAALERALGGLLYLAEQAERRAQGADYLGLDSGARRWPLPGPLVDELLSEPLSWFEHERATLVPAVRQASEAGLIKLCWGLACSMETLSGVGAYFDDWRETTGIALTATRKAGDVRGQAATLYHRGNLGLEQQLLGPARRDLEESARLFRDLAEDHYFAKATCGIAIIEGLNGRRNDAVERYEQALAIFRRTGDHIQVAYVLKNLAHFKLESNELDAALDLLSEALRQTQIAGAGRADAQMVHRVDAQILHRMGEAYLVAGDPGRAIGIFEQALGKVRGIGDPVGEAYVLRGLGVAQTRLGEFAAARAALQRALNLAAASSVQLVEARMLLGLSELALASGDPRQAASLAQQAATSFHDIGTPLLAEQALTLLSSAQAALGDSTAAAAAAGHAAALRFRRTGSAQPRQQ